MEKRRRLPPLNSLRALEALRETGAVSAAARRLMNIGVNYMREHMPDSARLHYAYLDAGGEAANVVQAKATVRQLVRASTLPDLRGLVDRVRKIADGAALMTETRVTSKVFSGVSNLLGNRPLEETMQAELEKLGPVVFDAQDIAFAQEIQQTLTAADIDATFRRIGAKPKKDLALCDFIAPLDRPSGGEEGSTDVGDVSWAVPTVQARVATCAIGTQFHTWQTVSQGKAPAAHKGLTYAAKVMAATACRLIEDPELVAAAKDTHRGHLSETPYVCPIPDDVGPPV